jgi:hypothetical protein
MDAGVVMLDAKFGWVGMLILGVVNVMLSALNVSLIYRMHMFFHILPEIAHAHWNRRKRRHFFLLPTKFLLFVYAVFSIYLSD